MPFENQNNAQENSDELSQFESSPAYQGSLQQQLENNIGEYVTIEFLIGMSEIVTRSGVLHSVGINYVVLYDEASGNYEVCDLYSIEFVTFYDRRVNS